MMKGWTQSWQWFVCCSNGCRCGWTLRKQQAAETCRGIGNVWGGNGGCGGSSKISNLPMKVLNCISFQICKTKILHLLILVIAERITRLVDQVLQFRIFIEFLLNILFGPTRFGNVLLQLCLQLLDWFLLSAHHGVRKQLSCNYDENNVRNDGQVGVVFAMKWWSHGPWLDGINQRHRKEIIAAAAEL